jgi:hypothetical protein
MNSLDQEFLKRVEGTELGERTKKLFENPRLTKFLIKELTYTTPFGEKKVGLMRPNCFGGTLWQLELDHLAEEFASFAELGSDYALNFYYDRPNDSPVPFIGTDNFRMILDFYFKRVEPNEVDQGVMVLWGVGNVKDSRLIQNSRPIFIAHAGIFSRKENDNILMASVGGMGGDLETLKIENDGTQLVDSSGKYVNGMYWPLVEEITFYVPKEGIK